MESYKPIRKRLIRPKFKPGDYVSRNNKTDVEYRVFSAKSSKEIIIIELTEDPTQQIVYIQEHQDNLELKRNSPLRFFKNARAVYNKIHKESGWTVRSVAPSPISERFDIARCYRGHFGNYEYKNFLVHDIVPDQERKCVGDCDEILHYSTHEDCPVCRYYICSEGHCECNSKGMNSDQIK